MELIVAVQELARPGGPQTYALTVGEQFARLGHAVTLFARELGDVAGLARERCLNVTAQISELPERADGVLVGVDRSLAFELADRYPQAARVFVMHSIDEIHLPPPVDGVVAATVALNDRFAARAAACVGAGEVVRMRQPVDLRRFGVSNRKPAPRAERVLLLGNYHGQPGSRAQILKDAWAPAGLQWKQVGYPNVSLDVTSAIEDVDIVVGYGRSIVEAMGRGKAAYVFDHAGVDGWVTPESYERVEAAGFSGTSAAPPPDAARLRADLDAYRPELGRLGHDLIRKHHDARDHATALVALLRRLGPEPPPLEHSALRALALLSEAQLRAEIARDNSRAEALQWFGRAQALNDQLAVQVARLEAVQASRRYRLAQVLGRGAEMLRGARGAPRNRRS